MTTIAATLPSLNRSFAERKRRFYADMERVMHNSNGGASGNTEEADEIVKRARLADSLLATPRIIYVTPLPADGNTNVDCFDDATLSTASTTSLNHSIPLPYQGAVCIGTRQCTHCCMTPAERYVNTQHNIGLLHTLYAYGDFFAELFKIYEARLALGKPSTEIRDRVASLMTVYNLSHRSRPVSLRVPFEQGLKNNSYIHFNGWLCPSVTRALSLATVVLTSERRARNFMTGINFHQNVVLPTLIYLHEALARRAKAKKQSAYAVRLAPIQDEVSQHSDVFLSFLTTTSVRDAERQCSEFAASQFAALVPWNVGRHPNAYVMEEMSNGTMSALQTVLNAYNDNQMTRAESEDAFCRVLYENGRSGMDYMMPGQTPVTPRDWHAIRRGTDHAAQFVDTPPPTPAHVAAPLPDTLAMEPELEARFAAAMARINRSAVFNELQK